MDLTPTTYTAPSSLASAPVAPIYSTWHALAGDFLKLSPTIRAIPLDLLATSLGVPVWRTAWPDGVKAQVLAWYGQYGGRLYTRAGLAAFVWIFGGNLTTWGAITDYWETDPAGTAGTTAATPSSPLAYTDDVISSYIGKWMPLGRTLTLDSSAAVIGRTRTLRRILVRIISRNPTLVPLGTSVSVVAAGTGIGYEFELISLDPTDDSAFFTGIIRARTYDDGNNDPTDSIGLVGIAPTVATVFTDDSIPDGILQYGYPDVATGDAVLTSGRPGWDAVVTTTRAVLSIEVYNSTDGGGDEFYNCAPWTATYASGDVIRFCANPGNENVVERAVGGGTGVTLTFVALQGGPLANSAFVSFTPDAPDNPSVYVGMPVPVIVDILEYGDTYTYPAIPAIPALGTPVPLPPFATVAPVVLTDRQYYKAELAKMPGIACGQVYISSNAVTIRPMLAPDYRVGNASTLAAVNFRFNSLGLARGAHVITSKNLNAANKTVSLSVLLNGVSVKEFEAFAIPAARDFITALGARACDAEGSYVTLDASGLATAIRLAYGDESTLQYIYATSSNVRYPAASTSVVYTAGGYALVPNGLAVDNAVGVVLAFTYQ